MQTLHLAAAAANALVAEARPPKDSQDGVSYRREVAEERAALGPLVLVLQMHALAVGRLLNDSDGPVRGTSLATLGEWVHARRRLLDRAASAGNSNPISPEQGGGNLQALAEKLPSQAMPVEAVAALIGDRNLKVRLAALDILEALGPTAEPAGPAIVGALNDPNRFVGWAAARALGKIGPVAPDRAVPALTRLMREGDDDVRLTAATTLACYGPDAHTAILPLMTALASDHAALRSVALRALENIGLAAKPAIPAIRDALDDGDADVRQSAARLLGKFGPSARDALNSLERRLKDDSPAVRTAAQEALLRINGRPAQ
jgi:HEAT repeat protein